MPKQFLRKATKTVLVVSNVALALFLVLGCYGSYLNQQRFWFSGLFTLATLYFLLLTAGFLIFWFFVKPRMMLISFVAIVLCWGPLTHAFRIGINDSFNVKKDSAALRIMTWNVEHFDILEHKTHPEKKDQMIALVNGYGPDIACFQEMVASDFEPGAINYLPDFLQRFGMPYYHYAYDPKLDFDKHHRFGIITISRFPIIRSKTIVSRPHNYNYTFQYNDIAIGNDTFRVFNIHLQSLKFSTDNKKYIDDPSLNSETDLEKSKNVIAKLRKGFARRKEQVDIIRKWIDGSPYPVIVCGDFNDVPNSYAYRTVGKGLQNVFAEKGRGIGNTYDGISPTLRIDHIFVDERFEVKQYTRTRKSLSDHFPVIADVEIKK